METLFLFLAKSSGLLAMFYLAYYFLLRKETFFNSNRWFLLTGLITSVVLPLVVFTKIVWVDPTPTNFDWSKIPVTTSIENESFEINWYFVFAVVYSIGILGFLLKFVFDFYSLFKVLKGKTIQNQADFKLIDITENIAPFSFFKSIVYNSSLYSDRELENILEHEKVHSTQNHTADVLISRLFCVVFWFHPLVWLYKKAIIQNLEFIADSEASKNISDKKAYQLTLLKITTQENCVAITNHFYQPCLPAGRSLIKKRIVMLNKNQSNKRNSWKYAAVLPLLGAFLFFFQVKVVAQVKAAPKQTEIKSQKIDKTNLIITKNTTDEEIKEHCEQIKKLYNIDLTFFNIKRNSNGEIINIESKYNNETGSGSCNASDNTPIKPFKFFYDKTKKEMGYDMDLASNSIENEIYMNGKKTKDEKFAKLVPTQIKSKEVVKNSNKTANIETTRLVSKPNNFTGKIIYIDGVKSDEKELALLNKNFIDKIDVNLDNTVVIQTKNETRLKMTIDGGNEGGEDNVFKGKTEFRNQLLVVNGKITTRDPRDLNLDLITSVKQLDKKQSIIKYGNEGKNGAIELMTKNNIFPFSSEVHNWPSE